MLNQLNQPSLGKLILRLGVGMLVLFHGIAKLGNAGSVGFISGQLANTGLPTVLAYGVYVGEILAPLLIILGIQSRLGGLLLAVNMLFAIGLVHMDELFALSEHGGWAIELQAMYLLGGLAVMFLGSGRFALKPD
jgi:putative oxidoreductase